MNRTPARSVMWLALMTSLVLLAACGGAAPGADAPPRPPLRIAAYYWPGQFWIDIAVDKGWFREAGVDVAIVDTNPDYFASIKAFVAGDIDLHVCTLFDTILFNARGANLVGIAITDQSHGADGIGARPGITTVAALAGQRVAVSKGTYTEFMLGVVLARAGRSLTEVVLVDTSAETAGTKLTDGSVDAIVTFEPMLSEAIKAVGGKKLWDSSEIPGISPALLAANQAMVRERPDDFIKVLQVWNRATEYIRQQPGEAYAIVARMNGKTPTEVRAFAALDRTLDLQENLAAFSFANGFESIHGSARVMNQFLIKRQLVSRRLDSEEFLSSDFLKKLR